MPPPILFSSLCLAAGRQSGKNPRYKSRLAQKSPMQSLTTESEPRGRIVGLSDKCFLFSCCEQAAKHSSNFVEQHADLERRDPINVPIQH